MVVFLQEPIDPMTRALVLAIGVCYHAKLQEKRQDYREVVAQSFKAPCVLPGGEKQILREITRSLFSLSIRSSGLCRIGHLKFEKQLQMSP